MACSCCAECGNKVPKSCKSPWHLCSMPTHLRGWMCTLCRLATHLKGCTVLWDEHGETGAESDI